MKMHKLTESMLIGLKLNLQLFAEGEGSDAGAAEGSDSGGGQSSDESGEEAVSFKNQSEFDSEVDKRIAKALKKSQAAWEADSEKRIAEAKSEGERLAKMNEEQRSALEKQQQDEALAKRESEIVRRELRAESLEQLAERDLPKELIDVVVLTDAKACSASIEAIEKSFRAAVESAVNKRLADSATNPAGNDSAKASKTSVGSQYAKQANNRTKAPASLWDK